MSMWKECEGLQEELVKIRRELHQIPEFGFDLPETQKYVTDKLDELGIPYKCSGTDSSIIAEIKGGQPGKTVALRADMDALKITEANDVDYKSKHEGLMHACGHDNHIAMLLGAAKVLNAHKAEIKGNVRLLFQTAEELSKGAEIMIKDGAMDGVDAVFGQHIGSIINKDIPAGKVIVTPGCCMASFDRFVIHVKGTGCHGSTPEKGTDPITMASHIVINLQEIIAREVSAVKAAVVTIGYFHGGVAYNAIPSEVEIEGTIRALEEPIRQYLAKRIEEIAKSTAATFRGTAEVEMDWGAPPVINNDEMAALITTSHFESPPLIFVLKFSSAGVKRPVTTSHPAPLSAITNQLTAITFSVNPAPPSSAPAASAPSVAAVSSVGAAPMMESLCHAIGPPIEVIRPTITINTPSAGPIAEMRPTLNAVFGTVAGMFAFTVIFFAIRI